MDTEEARLRPEEELLDSIQSQVVQALFETELRDRAGFLSQAQSSEENKIQRPGVENDLPVPKSEGLLRVARPNFDSRRVVEGRIGLPTEEVKGLRRLIPILRPEPDSNSIHPLETDSESREQPKLRPFQPEQPSLRPIEQEQIRLRNIQLEQPSLRPIEQDQLRLRPIQLEQSSQSLTHQKQPRLRPIQLEQPNLRPIEQDQLRLRPIQLEKSSQSPTDQEQPRLRLIQLEQPNLRQMEQEQSRLRPIQLEQPSLRPIEQEQSRLRPIKPEQPSLRPIEQEQSRFRPIHLEQPSLRPIVQEQLRLRNIQLEQQSLRPIKQEQSRLRPIHLEQTSLRPIEQELSRLRPIQLEQPLLRPNESEELRVRPIQAEQSRLRTMEQEHSRLRPIQIEQEQLILRPIQLEQPRLRPIIEDQKSGLKPIEQEQVMFGGVFQDEQSRVGQIKQEQQRLKQSEPNIKTEQGELRSRLSLLLASESSSEELRSKLTSILGLDERNERIIGIDKPNSFHVFGQHDAGLDQSNNVRLDQSIYLPVDKVHPIQRPSSGPLRSIFSNTGQLHSPSNVQLSQPSEQLLDESHGDVRRQPNIFFPSGSVRVLPVPAVPVPDDMIELDGIKVPMFSKMVKNSRLSLLSSGGSLDSARLPKNPNHGRLRSHMVDIDGIEVPMFSKMVKNRMLNLLQQESTDSFPNSARQVEVDGIKVPMFSKMVTNIGLKLLQEPASHSTQSLEVRERSKDRARASIKKQGRKDPEPVVQGFRVKGDTTNRVIFLNVADLGLSLGEGQLRIGNSELIPVEGLTSFSDTVERDGGGAVGKDAMKKMLMTHLQHPHAAHVPVELPGPELHQRGQLSSSAVPGDSKEPGLVSNQPRRFFNKFDGIKPQDHVQPRTPLPAEPSSASQQFGETVQPRANTGSFSSFPSQSGISLPTINTNQQQARQQQQVTQPQQQFPRQQQQLSNLQQLPRQQKSENINTLIDSVYEGSSRREDALNENMYRDPYGSPHQIDAHPKVI